MKGSEQNKAEVHPLERLLAILGAATCLVITVVIWRSIDTYQSMWLLPGFYFVEMVALAIVGALVFMRSVYLGTVITWAAAGIFSAFSISGMWSVGFFYLPIALIFAIISISSDVRNKQPIAARLPIFLIAAIVQGLLMIALIRLL